MCPDASRCVLLIRNLGAVCNMPLVHVRNNKPILVIGWGPNYENKHFEADTATMQGLSLALYGKKNRSASARLRFDFINLNQYYHGKDKQTTCDKICRLDALGTVVALEKEMIIAKYKGCIVWSPSVAERLLETQNILTGKRYAVIPSVKYKVQEDFGVLFTVIDHPLNLNFNLKGRDASRNAMLELEQSLTGAASIAA